MYLALVYYIQSLVGCSWLITVAGPVATANFLFIYWKKGRPSIFNAGEKLSLSFIVIFVATYIISLINLSLNLLELYLDRLPRFIMIFFSILEILYLLARAFLREIFELMVLHFTITIFMSLFLQVQKYLPF